ncbi:MAG: lysophospholipid acyltransferase family protein [Burkholderiaceae bacterium]
MQDQHGLPRSVLRVGWRFPALFGWMVLGLAWSLTGFRLVGPSGRSWSIGTFARGLLRVCGVRLRAAGAGPIPAPALLVGNHVSWLDIFVVHALQPVTFIAKSEIRSWPVIGTLVSASGTLFIERGNRAAMPRVIEEAIVRFGRQERVMFFPEGTTSDGTSLLKFHSSLFVLAERQPDLPIVPVSIQYSSGRTAYIGDTTLLRSMVTILSGPPVEVLLQIQPALSAQDRRRQALAEAARESVALGLRVQPQDSSADC